MAGFTGFGLAQISPEECVLEVVTFSTVKVFIISSKNFTVEISIIFFCPFEHCRVRVSVVICNTQNVIVVVCFLKIFSQEDFVNYCALSSAAYQRDQSPSVVFI